jgi:hypothetical protein
MPTTSTPTKSAIAPSSRLNIMQNHSKWITLNQNGNIRKASVTGYFNIRTSEPYKIEIFSMDFPNAVSVKIDGKSIIEGLICDRTVTLEEPEAIGKQFIGLKAGDPREGEVHNSDLGLIEVTFIPIKLRAISSRNSSQRFMTIDGQKLIPTNDWVEAPEIAPNYIKKYHLFGTSRENAPIQG